MWFVRFVSSSLGKKAVMALSGLLLLLFLCTHAAGNATIFMGRDVFQGYANELHSHPLIVLLFSSGLFLVFLAHIGVGTMLYLQGRQESISRYSVSVRVVENSLAAKTMPYSGLCILVFVLVHVAGFAFGPEHELISETVKRLLGHFFYSLFYLAGFSALALHVSHGFWSMLQTFGVNHPRYNALIAKLTLVIPLFFLALFGGIALYFMTGMGSSF
jgi:succinate dehydrogenase / fumarate reductase cytochrome b subunit